MTLLATEDLEIFSPDDIVRILNRAYPSSSIFFEVATEISATINPIAARFIWGLQTKNATDRPRIVRDMDAVVKRIELLKEWLFQRADFEVSSSPQSLADILADIDGGHRAPLAALSREIGKGEVQDGLMQIFELMAQLEQMAIAAESVGVRHRAEINEVFPSAEELAIASINAVAIKLGVKIGVSRSTETSRTPGRPSGPMVRFLTSLFGHIRQILRREGDLAYIADHPRLSPSPHSLRNWIGKAKQHRQVLGLASF